MLSFNLFNALCDLFFKASDPSLFADFNDYCKYNHFLFNSGHIVNILQYLDTVRYH